MNELIKIEKQVIGDEEINAVDARELHEFLESKQDFSTWVKKRIEMYNFTQGIDFIQYHNFVGSDSKARIDYTISTDMAKELSMVERNHKGKEARQYFISMEKKAMSTNNKTFKGINNKVVKALEASIKAANAIGVVGNQGILLANEAVKKTHGIDCMDLLGITELDLNQTIPTKQEIFTIPEKVDGSFSVTFLLKKYNYQNNAIEFNKVMIKHGMIFDSIQPDSRGIVSRVKTLIGGGLKYGYNSHYTTNGVACMPLYFEKSFVDLYSMLFSSVSPTFEDTFPKVSKKCMFGNFNIYDYKW